jgi:predicted GNAT family N-acyltransferase
MYNIEPISRYHHRDAFHCGKPSLDLYLQLYARQNDEKNLAKAFVIVDTQQQIMGYYTLSAASIEFESLPVNHRQRCSDYPVPAALITHLAVDINLRGQGMGARLLRDALHRISSATDHLAIKAVLVDAIDIEARDFYRHFGFIDLPGQTGKLFLPVETIRQPHSPT